MSGLALQRCLHHEAREAVCRCPSCRNFFCRECVVVFESRLLCSACLTQSTAAALATPERSSRFDITGVALAAVGLLIAWLLFYLAGWSVLQFREQVDLPTTSSALTQSTS